MKLGWICWAGAAALLCSEGAAGLDVLDVSDIATFEAAGHTSPTLVTNVNIEYQSVVGTGVSAIGYGTGGKFVIGQGAKQTLCVSDHILVLKDASNNCYYRQFSGAIHLSWYGVTNATPDATAQLNATLFAASKIGDGSNGKTSQNGCLDLDGLRVHIGSDTDDTTRFELLPVSWTPSLGATWNRRCCHGTEEVHAGVQA